MKKKMFAFFALCAVQTMQAARPVIEVKPAPTTTQMQMNKNSIGSTTASSAQDMPQPIQISEQHLAGHTQKTVTTLKNATPVAMPVAIQPTAPTKDLEVTQQAPVTLTPNTPGTVSPAALKQQLKQLQEHLTLVTQQIDVMTAPEAQ